MKKLLITSIIIFLTTTIWMCKKDDLTSMDKILINEINTKTGYTYYKNDSTIKASSKESGHNAFFRIRFNTIAQNALTDNNKLPINSSFPEGSIIVKELYDSQTGDLQLYSVMKKTYDSNASSGWLWAEYNPNGSLVYSISKKGAVCTGCHSSNARDYVRVFNLFP